MSGTVEMDAMIKHSGRVKSIKKSSLNSTHIKASSRDSHETSQAVDQHRSVEPSVKVQSLPKLISMAHSEIS